MDDHGLRIPTGRDGTFQSLSGDVRAIIASAVWVVLMTAPASADPVPPGPPAASERRGIDVTGLPLNTGVSYSVEGGTDADARPGPTRASHRAATPRVFFGDFPVLVAGPDGRYCIRVVRRPYSEFETAATYEVRQEQRWMELTRQYQLCTGVAPPARSPAAQAAEYWRVIGEDLLPRPRPHIAPGYMLAGKLAFLEVRSPLTARFEHATPLGVLAVEATSRVYVDWGDGSALDGPHDDAGGPWPSGRITYYWTVASTYDVRVVQRWTARWSLGGATGDLGGLATEGIIDDFEVADLQAVRNY